MARPKKYAQHKIKALEFYQARTGEGEVVSALDIEEDLKAEYPEGTASYRLIAQWVREFKDRNEKQKLLDSPFQWSHLEDYRLPWESGSFFMEMMAADYQQKIDIQTGNVVHFTPTGRDALWWWRVNQATPEIPNKVGSLWDIRYLAAQFAYREIASELLGEPMFTVDLEARLTLKPWLDAEHHADYHRAIELGFAPAVVPINNLARVCQLLQVGPDKPVELQGWMEGSAVLLPSHPELLLTQQRDIVQANPALLQAGQIPSENEINKVLWAPKREEETNG